MARDSAAVKALKINRIIEALRLARRAFAGYKKHMVALAALGFLSGLLEGIGVNALIPLFSFFSGDGRGGDDFISRKIEKFFAFLNVDFGLITILVFIVILFIGKAAALLLFEYIKIRIRNNYEKQTRDNLFAVTLGADWPFLLKQRIGYLETILKLDVKQSAMLFDTLARAIMVFSGLLIYLVIALNISQTITVVTVVFGAFLMLFLKPLLFRVRKTSEKVAELNKDGAHLINESIAGVKTLKVMGAEGDKLRSASGVFEEMRALDIRASMLKQFSSVLIQPASVILIAFIVAFSFFQTSYNLGALAAVIYLIQRIFTHIQSSQNILHSVSNAAPYTKAVLSYEDEARSARERRTERGGRPFAFEDSLVFEDVEFHYGAGLPVLSGLNLTIKKGDMIGLVGPSGAGKTTLFDLALRLLNPTGGRILLDGTDIKEISIKEWRRNIGYVSQDTFLMNDTVMNNIRFFAEAVGEEDARQAAKAAGADEFIRKLPQGYDTLVGERGVLLSVGQRQRVAIARALARKPRLLLLDEATSALDAESERAIQRTIKNLKGKTTVFIIAHRLSTVLDSDALVALKDGKVSEKGSPAELLKDKDTYFYKMYNIRES